jgi:hypothetical protein
LICRDWSQAVEINRANLPMTVPFLLIKTIDVALCL